MTSVRVINDVFEASKTYPVITCLGIREMTGEEILFRQRSKQMNLTIGDYSDIINEIKRLKEEVNELRKSANA